MAHLPYRGEPPASGTSDEQEGDAVSRASLLARRSAAQRGLLALVWLLVTAVAGTTGVTLGYVQATATDGARAGLEAAGPSGRALLLSTRLADDDAGAALQDARVRDAVEEALGGTAYALAHDVRTEPLRTVADAGGSGGDLGRWVVESLPAASGEATSGGAPGDGLALVDGTWPAADGEAAVQADAAAAVGLAVGDTLRLGADPDDPGSGTSVTINGTWRVTDPDDPRWFGDPLVLAGADGGALGPVVTTAATVGALDTDPFARWTVVPDLERLALGDLGTLGGLAERLDSGVGDDDEVAPRGLTLAGTLAETAARTTEALRAAAAVALVPLLLLVVVSLVATVQVARLLAGTREHEVALLVSRGADPATVTAGGAVEAALLAATAAGAGGLAAALVLEALVPGSRQAGTLLVVATGVAVGGAAVLTGVAAVQARSAARRQLTDRSGRVRTVAALGTVLLTFAGAAVCLVQLRRYGSPLVATPDGLRTDPLAALAPALVLTALAVVATALLGPVTRVWARLAERSPGAVGVLAARQVARRLVVYVVPVVLLVLAGGSATLAGAFAETSGRFQEDVALLRTGTDVRVALPPGAEGDAAPFSAIVGVSAAVPVLAADVAVDGSPSTTLLAMAAADLPEVVRAPGGSFDAAGIAAAIDRSPFAAAPGLPAGARTVTATVTGSVVPSAPDAEPFPGWNELAERGSRFGVALVLVAPDGTVSTVDLGELQYDLDGDGAGTRPVGAQPVTYELTADLPASAEPFRLAAVDLTASAGGVPLEAQLVVDTLVADGVPVDLSGQWRESAMSGADLEASSPGRIEVVVPEELSMTRVAPFTARLLPGDPPGALPAVVTAPLARTLDLSPGDSLEVPVQGRPVPLAVAATTEVLPGTLTSAGAIVVDRLALAELVLWTSVDAPPADEVWLAAGSATPDDVQRIGAEAQVTADALLDRGASTVTTLADALPVDATAPVRTAFWLAAVGSVVLATAGVLAVALAGARVRRGEVIVLRVVGVGPRDQGRARAGELFAVGGAAVVLGAGAGVVAAWLTVPGLVGATLGGDAVRPELVAQSLPAVVLLAGCLAALGLVAAGVGARVAAQARDTDHREEVR